MSKREPEAESDASDDEKEVQEIDLKNVDELAPEIANLFIKKAPVLAAEEQEESDAEEAPKAAADGKLTEDQKFIAADAEAEPEADDEAEAESADEADDEEDAEEDEAEEEEEEEKPIDYSLGFGTFGGMGYDPTGYFESKGGEAPTGLSMPKNAFMDKGFGSNGSISGLVQGSFSGPSAFGGFGGGFGGFGGGGSFW